MFDVYTVGNVVQVEYITPAGNKAYAPKLQVQHDGVISRCGSLSNVRGLNMMDQWEVLKMLVVCYEKAKEIRASITPHNPNFDGISFEKLPEGINTRFGIVGRIGMVDNISVIVRKNYNTPSVNIICLLDRYPEKQLELFTRCYESAMLYSL